MRGSSCGRTVSCSWRTHVSQMGQWLCLTHTPLDSDPPRKGVARPWGSSLGMCQGAAFPQGVMLLGWLPRDHSGTSTDTCLTPASRWERMCATWPPPGHDGTSTDTCLSPVWCWMHSLGKTSPIHPRPTRAPLTMSPSQASAWEHRALSGGMSHSGLQTGPQMVPVVTWSALAVGRRVTRLRSLQWLHLGLWETVSLRSQVSGAPTAVLSWVAPVGPRGVWGKEEGQEVCGPGDSGGATL